MHALHFATGQAQLVDLQPPQPLPGECRVRVLQAGVCATDLALRRGYMAFTGVPGHEFVGVALEGPHAGRRVVGEINASCGRCTFCRQDLGRHCPTRTVLGILGRQGAFAEQITLPAQNLHALPDEVSTDAAVFAEPLAAAFEILQQVALRPGVRTLVVGDGRLGLLCAWVLHVGGAAVAVSGHHHERGSLLPAGVRHEGDLLAQPATPATWFELAVEATGKAQTLARLLPHVRPRGTIVLKTTCEQGALLDLAPLVVNEITLVGSRCGPFAPALAELASRRIPVERLIAARYPLSRAPQALEHAARAGTLKVLIECAKA